MLPTGRLWMECKTPLWQHLGAGSPAAPFSVLCAFELRIGSRGIVVLGEAWVGFEMGCFAVQAFGARLVFSVFAGPRTWEGSATSLWRPPSSVWQGHKGTLRLLVCNNLPFPFQAAVPLSPTLSCSFAC